MRVPVITPPESMNADGNERSSREGPAPSSVAAHCDVSVPETATPRLGAGVRLRCGQANGEPFRPLFGLPFGVDRGCRQLARNPNVASPAATPSHASHDAHETVEPVAAPQISGPPRPSAAPRPA